MEHLRVTNFENLLARARRNADLGLPVASKTRFRILKRLIARATWLTNRQQVEYNKSILRAVEHLVREIDTNAAGLTNLATQIDTNAAAAQRNYAALEASLRSEIAGTLLGNARRDRAIGQLRAEFEGVGLEARPQRSSEPSGHVTPWPIRRGELEESGLSFGAFADRFRGSEETVIERQRPLLPEIEGMPGPLLDLGSGRGEWLRLLRESGIAASGIDSDAANVLRCQAQGLEVVEGDVLTHLQSLDGDSLGAITAFHIVEHLSFVDFVELVREAHRVVRPGGKLLLETPNTTNLLVGASSFHIDPGHILPLHPLLIEFVLDAIGFGSVSVRAINPPPTLAPTHDGPAGLDEVINTINAHLFAGQDTLAVGSKPTRSDLH
jgi:SAM-dependent methyltransferase